MKQFQFSYQNQTQFQHELSVIAEWLQKHTASGVIFQIFSEYLEQEFLTNVCQMIEQQVPQALYMGCSTNGNILNGCVETRLTVTCTVFEKESSKIHLMQLPLNTESAKDTVQKLRDFILENPWVKAVEMLLTIRGMSMTEFCQELEQLPTKIQIFGGGAFSSEMNNEACVFSSGNPISFHSVAFLLFGGEEIHVRTTYVTGWKPLGKKFHVTRAENNILYELDGKPAYDAYYRYLNIRNDEHFFTNTLEFPFFYEHNGLNILRAPVSSNADGSLVMTSDIDEDTIARIAYGDSWTILQNIRKTGEKIRQFQPDIIKIYSCAARRTFWGMDEISKETAPFQTIALTSGFYTSSEFLRTNGFVNQHNVTLVIGAVREGKSALENQPNFEMREETFSGRVSMVSRLATFIEVATEELEEANHKLEVMAVSDGLTQLYNRHEIERQIKRRLKECKRDSSKKLCLIMLDIDNFKKVNDTYGHKEGDNVIVGLARMMRDGTRRYTPQATVGRWGGEEFMMLMPYSLEEATEVAEHLRTDFSDTDFELAGHQTVSIGVTEWIPGENSDALCIRVDKALYQAKETGKNKVVVL